MNHFHNTKRWLTALFVASLTSVLTPAQATVITNSGTFSVGGASATDSNNVVVVTNSVLPVIQMTSGAVLVGAGFSAGIGQTGGSGNTVILSNALLTSTAANNWIGFGSSNNSLTLLGGAVWDASGQKITIGQSGLGSGTKAFGNVLYVLSGGILSNAVVGVGTNNPSYPKGGVANGLVVSNGGLAVLNGLHVGSSWENANSGSQTYSNNFAYISNATVAASIGLSRGYITIGNGGGITNTAVLANVMWNGNNGTIDVGSGRTSNTKGNGLTIKDGSILTNFSTISIGRQQEALNYTNSGNFLEVSGANTLLSGVTLQMGVTDKSGGSASAGGGNSSSNALNIMSGATVITTNGYLGYAATTPGAGTLTTNLVSSNQGLVGGGIWTNRGDIILGYSFNQTANNETLIATNNSFLITDGGNVWTTNFVVGAAVSGIGIAKAVNNQAIVSNGATLVSETVTIGFTRQTSAGANSALDNSLVLATGGNAKIKNLYVGDPSGGTSTGNQLIMAGGTANAQNVTIRNSNTLTFNGGTLNVSGVLSNLSGGPLVVGDGVQAAALNLTGTNQHFLVSGLTIANNGLLNANGTILGDVNVAGTISPIDALTITGNLTLASSAITFMELMGYGAGQGTNDLLTVGLTLQFDGELQVVNSTGFTYAGGQSFHLFDAGTFVGDFATTNLPDLSVYGLGWDTAQLGTLGTISIIVVPEPSTMVLLGGSLLMLYGFRRRRAA